MNPLVKKTTEKVIGGEITENTMYISVIIGEAILASQENPNFNLKGGNDVDENTIGNFSLNAP